MVSQYLVVEGRWREAQVSRAKLTGQQRFTRDLPTAPLQEPLADYYLYCDGDVPLLFTENETNHARLFGSANASPYVKDGIDRCRRAWRRGRGERRAGGDQGRGPLPGYGRSPARRTSSGCG